LDGNARCCYAGSANDGPDCNQKGKNKCSGKLLGGSRQLGCKRPLLLCPAVCQLVPSHRGMPAVGCKRRHNFRNLLKAVEGRLADGPATCHWRPHGRLLKGAGTQCSGEHEWRRKCILAEAFALTAWVQTLYIGDEWPSSNLGKYQPQPKPRAADHTRAAPQQPQFVIGPRNERRVLSSAKGLCPARARPSSTRLSEAALLVARLVGSSPTQGVRRRFHFRSV